MYRNISKILGTFGTVGGGILGGTISFYLTTSGCLLNSKKNYWERVFSVKTLIVSSLGFLGGLYISSDIKTKYLIRDH